MDEQNYKEVYFHEYCKKCKHEKLEDTEEPCAECMNNTINVDSHRPVKYEQKGPK